MRPRIIAVIVAGLVGVSSSFLPARPGRKPRPRPGGDSQTYRKNHSRLRHRHNRACECGDCAGQCRSEAAPPKAGDPVFLGDMLQTGADGKIDITFEDTTAFNLSSNARMVLNEFVYDPNGKSNSTFFSLTKGTFTFVAGKVAKTGDMKIDTPVATVGFPGTMPHVESRKMGPPNFPR